jgi:hypothetical protein
MLYSDSTDKIDRSVGFYLHFLCFFKKALAFVNYPTKETSFEYLVVDQVKYL